MRIQYLVDGVVVSREEHYKATTKKEIRILDMTLEHAEELRGLLERQLKNLEESEKYEKQKYPKQEYPKENSNNSSQ